MPTTTPPPVQTDAQIIASLNSGDNERSLVRSIIVAKTLASSSAVVPPTTGDNPKPGISARPGIKGFANAYRLSAMGANTEYYAELPYNPATLAATMSIEESLLPLPAPASLRPLVKAFSAPVAIANPPLSLSAWIYRLAVAQGGAINLVEDPVTGRDYISVAGSIARPLAELLSEITIEPVLT